MKVKEKIAYALAGGALGVGVLLASTTPALAAWSTYVNVQNLDDGVIKQSSSGTVYTVSGVGQLPQVGTFWHQQALQTVTKGKITIPRTFHASGAGSAGASNPLSGTVARCWWTTSIPTALQSTHTCKVNK